MADKVRNEAPVLRDNIKGMQPENILPASERMLNQQLAAAQVEPKIPIRRQIRELKDPGMMMTRVPGVRPRLTSNRKPYQPMGPEV
jgi:hypothetical protein